MADLQVYKSLVRSCLLPIVFFCREILEDTDTDYDMNVTEQVRAILD